MATKRLSMYEKALNRATKAFAEVLTEQDELAMERAAARWAKAHRVLEHFEEPVVGCVCEGCLWWDAQLRIHRAGRARK